LAQVISAPALQTARVVRGCALAAQLYTNMCGPGATLIVKNTFICVQDEQSPAVQPQRVRAKTDFMAATPEEYCVDQLDAILGAETSEGDSISSHEFAFEEEDSSQLTQSIQCIVKNTFICAVGPEENTPLNQQRARAKTEQPAMCWERESSEGDLSPRGLVIEDEESCELAQSAIEMGTADRQAIIAALQGRVFEAAKSQHAHKVLEAVVNYMTTDEAAFIAAELSGHGRDALLDASTCSVICRLLEHSPADWRTVLLVDELLSGDVAALCCHKSGHEVATTTISSGIPRQAAQVVYALHSNPQRFARHRFASKVVEAALRAFAVDGSDLLARELIAQPGTVVSLACHNFGVHVVRALLASPSYSKVVLHFLLKTLKRLAKDKYGRELMRDLGLAHMIA